MAWMALFGMIGAGLVGPNRPAIEQEFGLDHGQFGAGFAVIQTLMAGAVLYWASRSRQFDSVRALSLSLAGQAVGFAAICLSNSWIALVLGWSVIMAGLMLGSVCNSISAEIWQDNPARGVTLLHGFNGIGKVVGPLIAAACLTLGWRMSFLAVGIVNLLLFGGFLVYRRRHGSPVQSSPPDRAEPTGSLVSRPIFWLCVLPFGLIAGGDVAFAALVPVYYISAFGASLTDASILLTIHMVGLTVGRFAFSWLSGRISNNLIIGCCLLTGLFVFPAALSVDPVIRAGSLFGVGIMFSSTWPTFYAQAARFIPSSQRHLLDLGTGLGCALGIALCVYVSSVLADANLQAGMIAGPAALWIFGVLYYLTRLSRPVHLPGRPEQT